VALAARRAREFAITPPSKDPITGADRAGTEGYRLIRLPAAIPWLPPGLLAYVLFV
jgi:hypothetical protein